MADEIKINVPDIGGAKNVDVIEILVKPGDEIVKDTPLVTLESDKASMEIPSPQSGRVLAVSLKIGDQVSEGDAILTIASTQTSEKKEDSSAKSEKEENTSKQSEEKSSSAEEKQSIKSELEPSEAGVSMQQSKSSALSSLSSEFSQSVATQQSSATAVTAGPAVRRMAREFGVDLTQVVGSGRKSRISKDDLQNFIKHSLSEKSVGRGFSMPEVPAVDFSQFGSIDVKPLNKIKRLTGVNLHRSWITVPHVTQFDEADITELEKFRKMESDSVSQSGYKLTLLAFVTKVVGKALAEFPQFNASLDPSAQNLIYKKYYNIGIAVDTPNGLVVPVIKQVDQLSVVQIAAQMGVLSKKARDKTLTPADMTGGCFTISSLGGVGGTAFTPIVNAPEVAILGLSRAAIKPVFDQDEFKPRLMLPLSLSYDHRVIDGAEAARFTRLICELLGDIRRVLL